ncbi:MAG TPA: transglycosylase domain-containing protein, partial [Sphingomicrobium sp.]|nr:transglycosylase domain-containing protein [Sphingomicrobium sp.]
MPSLALKMPDLPRLNARVRDRLDPLFKRRWVRRAAWALVVGYALFIAIWLFFASGLPSSEKLLAYEPSLPTSVRGYDGNPIGTYARERRVELSFDEYPPLVVNAFVSAEDKTFFSHGGLDYPGLVGAVFDYTRKSVSGGRARGGSTITQQVAKGLLQDDEYSITRKIREAIL